MAAPRGWDVYVLWALASPREGVEQGWWGARVESRVQQLRAGSPQSSRAPAVPPTPGKRSRLGSLSPPVPLPAVFAPDMPVTRSLTAFEVLLKSPVLKVALSDQNISLYTIIPTLSVHATLFTFSLFKQLLTF